jgi:hypothetical protein
MRASVGTSHIFNTVQENQSTQAMVRSSVASRPGNSINWYIFSHLLRITIIFSKHVYKYIFITISGTYHNLSYSNI